MFYVSRGNVPHKRHTQHRAPDGSLYAEELFGVEGFTGRSSLLYHAVPPTQTDHIEAAAGRPEEAEAVLGHAVAIEKEYTRLRELRDVLPAVGVIVTERGRVNESERKSERLTKEREEKADARRVTEHALDQVRKKVAALKKTLGEDEAKRDRLSARLQELLSDAAGGQRLLRLRLLHEVHDPPGLVQPDQAQPADLKAGTRVVLQLSQDQTTVIAVRTVQGER